MHRCRASLRDCWAGMHAPLLSKHATMLGCPCSNMLQHFNQAQLKCMVRSACWRLPPSCRLWDVVAAGCALSGWTSSRSSPRRSTRLKAWTWCVRSRALLRHTAPPGDLRSTGPPATQPPHVPVVLAAHWARTMCAHSGCLHVLPAIGLHCPSTVPPRRHCSCSMHFNPLTALLCSLVVHPRCAPLDCFCVCTLDVHPSTALVVVCAPLVCTREGSFACFEFADRE